VTATTTYFGMASGAQILRYAPGNLGSYAFLPGFTTWDVAPAGEAGVVVFRGASWTFYSSNGYNIQMTIFVDGQQVGQPFAFQGFGSGEQVAPAQFAARGSRMSVQIQVMSLTGDLEHRNLQAFYTGLRTFPAK